MNSLLELNTYAATGITYSDIRDPVVVFNLANGVNQTNSVTQYQSHTVPVGIEIIDVIRPDVCLPTYTIDVSSNPGTTITWDTIPSGCVVTNPSTGVYRISGVNSVAIWNIIKSPRVTLPVFFIGTFTYTATVTFNTSFTESWTVTTTVADVVYLNSPSDQYFNVSGGTVSSEFSGSAYLTSAVGFTGSGTDSNTVTIAASIYIGSSASSAIYDIFSLRLGTSPDNNNRGIQLILYQGKLRFCRSNSSNSDKEIVFVDSALNYNAWNRFVLYIKGNGSNTAADCRCWINGEDKSVNIKTGFAAIGEYPLSGSILTNWSNTSGSTFKIGQKISGWGENLGTEFVGKLSYLYINGGESTAPNPAHFLPYDIGTNGTAGGAVQPYIFHYGNTTTFFANNGTGFAGYTLSEIGDVTNSSTDTVSVAVSTAPSITSEFSTNWTMRITPSTTAAVSTMTSSGAGGTTSFNNSTKVFTITGTRAQVNTHLQTLTVFVNGSQTTDFTMTYQATNLTLNDADAAPLQNWYSTYILGQTRGNETYSLNTTTTISNGPLITENVYADSTGYTMTVVPSPTAAVSSMSSTGHTQWTAIQTIDNPTPATNDYFPTEWLFSEDTNYLIVSNKVDNSSRGAVHIFVKSGGSFVLQQTLANSGGSPDDQFGSNIVVDSLGERFAINKTSGSGFVNIYKRTGTTWALERQIAPSGESQAFLADNTSMAINESGDTLVVAEKYSGDVTPTQSLLWIYRRAGTTWTLQHTLTLSNTNTAGPAEDIFLSEDGNTMVFNRYYAGNIALTGTYVYFYNGSSWSLQKEFTNDATRPRAVGLSKNGNTLYLWQNPHVVADYKTSIYTRTGSTWTFSSEIQDKVYRYSRDELTREVTEVISGTTTRTLEVYLDGAWQPGIDIGIAGSGNIYFHNGWYNSTYAASSNIFASNGGFANSGSITIYAKGTGRGTSYNAATKTLTITGYRAEINRDIDTIQLTPATGYNNNFTLTYTVTTPRSDTDNRTQNVNYT